ncbi:MAG: efflux RND transporter permease subunit [bacterium]|nr:efflux RND transporter permease subunit [bacterium]
MNISEIFIRRPVMTSLVMLGIMIFGIIGYRSLPVSDLPNVDFPTIQVSASLPGASPETMAASVATPLEKRFSTIAGIDSMNSVSSQGNTQITIQFNLSRDIDAAAQDVQAAISRALRSLPSEMPTPPSFQKVNPADAPIVMIALYSSTLPLYMLNEYAETILAQRLSMVNGVAQVMVYGGQKYAVRIQLAPQLLAAKGIAIDEVVSAVQKANVNMPTGTLYGAQQTLTIEADGQITEAEAYRPVIVTYKNGSPVRLEAIAKVVDSVENKRSAAWYIDKRAIVLAIQRQPGTNTVEVANAIRELLPTLRQYIPASVNMEILYDRSESIKESVNDVKFTLTLTVFLVILVIFLFLRNVSATIIPSLALPISIVGTFAVMYLFGYSLDNLSLMALTLSVGFVVDDAIVMLENIVRHMEQGEKPLEAAFKGSKEIGFTILSMTLSLAAVFIPILFMGGIIGRLFHEFAVTITSAILVSGVVSLTLTPMLSGRFLRPPGEMKHSRLFIASEKAFKAMLNAYDWSLKLVLKYRRATIISALLMLIVTVYLFIIIPKGFLPSGDVGMITASIEAMQGIPYPEMVRHQQAVVDIIRNNPNIDRFMSRVSGNSGGISMRLKPREERKLTPDQIIQELRPKLAKIPGIKVYLTNPPPIRIGGISSRSLYQFTLQSPDTRELYYYASLFEQRLKMMPELEDVASDLQLRNPQLNIQINRDKAMALGITPHQLEQTLYTAYGSRQISTIYAPNNDYPVIMEIEDQYQADPSSLSMLYIRSSNGNLVPLDAVANVSQGLGPQSINHAGQLPSVTLSFNLKPGVSLGEAVDKVQAAARQVLPDSISTNFAGSAQAFQSSMKGLGILLVMAILVIYLVLGILYESYAHPITILSGLPSAGIGALLTLLLFGVELNIYSFVGVIMLVGLVKKNAIMMIDFALEAQRTQGKTPAEAIYQGCLIRFRPIMMTTMCALMGTLPIALGVGAGGQTRQPLGLAVVGGLIFSQFVTLYITPVFYIYMESFSKKFGRFLQHFRRKPVADHESMA